MNELIKYFNEKYGDKYGKISYPRTTLQIYRTYQTIKSYGIKDEELINLLYDIRLPKPKTIEEKELYANCLYNKDDNEIEDELFEIKKEKCLYKKRFDTGNAVEFHNGNGNYIFLLDGEYSFDIKNSYQIILNGNRCQNVVNIRTDLISFHDSEKDDYISIGHITEDILKELEDDEIASILTPFIGKYFLSIGSLKQKNIQISLLENENCILNEKLSTDNTIFKKESDDWYKFENDIILSFDEFTPYYVLINQCKFSDIQTAWSEELQIALPNDGCFIIRNNEIMVTIDGHPKYIDIEVWEDSEKRLKNDIFNKDMVIKKSISMGTDSHTEGLGNVSIGRKVNVSGEGSFAIGYNVKIEGENSFATGQNIKIEKTLSSAIGDNINIKGFESHAIGDNIDINGDFAFAEGLGLIVSGDYQNVIGKYNIEDNSGKYFHIIGNGRNSKNRSNAHTLDWKGNAWYAGDVYVKGDNQNNGKKLLSTSDIYFNSDGELVVTINGVTKTFTPKA